MNLNLKVIIVSVLLATTVSSAYQCDRYFLDQKSDLEVHNQLIQMNAYLNPTGNLNSYTLITPEGRRVHIIEMAEIKNRKDIEKAEKEMEELERIGVSRLGSEVSPRVVVVDLNEYGPGGKDLSEAFVNSPSQIQGRKTPFIEVVSLWKQRLIDEHIQRQIEKKTNARFYWKALWTTVLLTEAYFFDTQLRPFLIFFATLQAVPLVMYKSFYPLEKAIAAEYFSGTQDLEVKKAAQQFLRSFRKGYDHFLRNFDDKHIIIISSIPLNFTKMDEYLIQNFSFKPAVFDIETMEYIPLKGAY